MMARRNAREKWLAALELPVTASIGIIITVSITVTNSLTFSAPTSIVAFSTLTFKDGISKISTCSSIFARIVCAWIELLSGFNSKTTKK